MQDKLQGTREEPVKLYRAERQLDDGQLAYLREMVARLRAELQSDNTPRPEQR